MSSFDERYEKVLALTHALAKNRDRMVEAAVSDLQFTVKDSAQEVEVARDRLQMYEEAQFLRDRVPLGGPRSRVCLLLAYNGSAWLNTAITSIYMVGNRVSVKYSSKGRRIMALTRELYEPVFASDISFFSGHGKDFIEAALNAPDVSAVVVFGFDENIMPYQEAFRRAGKKLIFEGPGQDPFIVFPDANLELAMEDLMAAKFMYSGQTCTAPKRIFIHESIYDEFLARFVERVKRLVVGDPSDPKTDVAAVVSDLAVERLRRQLADALQRGACLLAGGSIQDNLVAPTVMKGCTDDMLGMKEEVFGPVAFTTSFATREEVVRRAKNHRYGLRAAVFGGVEACKAAQALLGEPHCHPVPDYTFGRFGTVAYNQTRRESWRGALVTKPIGGYGYSGWIWETVDGRFQIKQGPKLLSMETSR
ncbi:MAG TPA: aldehyde dehydrogenase family protein [Candidatus Bathyarchaeia archaeon]|nr:aldehyde dehydrogenase family protein [Candidatus Bathyarchaeia archaeon]